MPFSSLGSLDGKAVQRRNEIREAFQRIIELSDREKADFLLICGDLYEHEYVKKSTITFIGDEFRRIPNTRVIIIPGNHDLYIPGSCYGTFEWPDNVYILAGDRKQIEFEAPHVRIFSSIQPSAGQIPPCIDVLMLHGTLNLGIAKNAFNPITGDQLDSSGMDYIALGHFHNRFEAKGKTRTAFNPGSPEPLGFDEEGSHGVYLARIFMDDNGDKRTETEFVKLNLRNYRNINVNCDNCGNDEKAADIIEAAAFEAGSSEDLFSITLKGAVQKGYKPDISRLEAILSRKCFFMKIKDKTVPEYDLEEIMKEPGLRGLFVKKLVERIRQAELNGDQEGREVAVASLYYGLQAMEQGEICL